MRRGALMMVMTLSSVMSFSQASSAFTVVAEQDSQSRLAYLKVVLRAGSSSDPISLAGVAHFTARAILRGTKTRPYRDLTDAIERLGGTIAVRVHHGHTVLDCSVLSGNLDSYLDILRDVLTQPAFDVREVNLLQTIISGEIRASLQDPRTLAQRAVLKGMYSGTPLEYPPEGVIDAVSRITARDLEIFHRVFYVQENLVIGAVTPLPIEELRAKVNSKLNIVPKGTLNSRNLPLPVLKGRKAIIVDRNNMSTTPMFIATPGVGDADPGMVSLELGNFVFGGDFTSRLVQILRVENGWTYGASSGYDQILAPYADPGLFTVHSFPSVEYAGLAIPRALSLLEEYARAGLTQAEFLQARESLGNHSAFYFETAQKRLKQRIREILNGRPVLDPNQYQSILENLSLDSVNEEIRLHFHLDPMLIAVIGNPEILTPVLRAIPQFEKSVEVIDIRP